MSKETQRPMHHVEDIVLLDPHMTQIPPCDKDTDITPTHRFVGRKNWKASKFV